MRLRLTTILLATTLAAATTASAAETRHTATLYLWATALDGTTDLGPGEPTDLDISFGDIWDNLELGGMLNYRAERDGWLFMGDVVAAQLDPEKSGSRGPVALDVSAEVDQVIAEVDVGRRIGERVVAFAGLRYNQFELDIETRRTGPVNSVTRSGDVSKDWVDPVVGALVELPLAESWIVALRGDVGGFGIASDFAWQAVASLRWQVTDNAHIVAGYRYYDVDYSDGAGDNEFVYDMAQSGPILGGGISF